MYIWIKSKIDLKMMWLIEKESRACLAKEQISHWQSQLGRTVRKLTLFIDEYGKCPSLICHSFTSKLAFKHTRKEVETGLHIELLKSINIWKALRLSWIALDFLWIGSDRDLFLLHKKLLASSLMALQDTIIKIEG